MRTREGLAIEVAAGDGREADERAGA